MGARRADERLERYYAAAVRLYPKRFRAAHAEPMRQAFRDALADAELNRRGFLWLAARDLTASLVKEYAAMLRETFGRATLIYNALVLGAVSTVLALALYAIPQQVLRQGANDPQIAMAGDLTAVLERGAALAGGLTAMLRQHVVPAVTGGPETVDMAQSLTPFVIVYNDQGQPLAAQGVLDGKAPALPGGVLDFVRAHGEERVSWQPRHGVRIAAVVQRVQGIEAGFVLAGRNMREVEAREAQVEQMAGLAWLGMLGLILLGTAIFGWVTRPRAA